MYTYKITNGNLGSFEATSGIGEFGLRVGSICLNPFGCKRDFAKEDREAGLVPSEAEAERLRKAAAARRAEQESQKAARQEQERKIVENAAALSKQRAADVTSKKKTMIMIAAGAIVVVWAIVFFLKSR